MEWDRHIKGVPSCLNEPNLHYLSQTCPMIWLRCDFSFPLSQTSVLTTTADSNDLDS